MPGNQKQIAPHFAPLIFAQFRQGLSVEELARAHGVDAATIESLIRQAMVDALDKRTREAYEDGAKDEYMCSLGFDRAWDPRDSENTDS